MEEVLIQMFKNGERIGKKSITNWDVQPYDRITTVRDFVRETKFKGNFLVQVLQFYDDADTSDKMFLYKVSVAESTVVNEYRVNTLSGRETVTIENLELHDLHMMFYNDDGDVKMVNCNFDRGALIPFLNVMKETNMVKVAYRTGVIADHVFAIEKVQRQVEGVVDIVEIRE
jgi:hypothetical protein